MCWSGGASAALAFGGLASSAYLYRKGEPKELCAALAYFSGMEALQAFTYSVIDQCSNPSNQVATLLGYLHITFQPFFINAISMHFIPKAVRIKIQPFVYSLCLVASWLFLMRLYPFGWAQPCYDVHYSIPFFSDWSPAVPFCGKTICSISGSWHIAWQIPVRYHQILDNSYLFAAFLLPLLYGSWRMTVYHVVSGPLLAYLTTSNANEMPAVWCLYSIGLLGVAVKSPLRRQLYVKSYWLWRLFPRSVGQDPLTPGLTAAPVAERAAVKNKLRAKTKRRGKNRVS